MAEALRQFFILKAGHPLIAWRHYFAREDQASINLEEFTAGLKGLGFIGSPAQLYTELDDDGSGQLTLDEVDPASADLWDAFKHWCVVTFSSPEDMICKLERSILPRVDGCRVADSSCRTSPASSRPQTPQSPRSPQHCEGPASPRGHFGDLQRGGLLLPGSAQKRLRQSSKPTLSALLQPEGISEQSFLENLVRLGWYASCELVLFRSLDPSGSGLVTAESLAWFDKECKLNKRRALRRKRWGSSDQAGQAQRNGDDQVHALQSFKAFLLSQHGHLFHAWRRWLDADGSMTVQRKELFSACSMLGWYGSIPALWRALDSDGSGGTTLDEFAMHEARALATFKVEANGRWGGVVGMFRKLLAASRSAERSGREDKKLDYGSWVSACQQLRCTCDAGYVFRLLNWEGVGLLGFRDVRWLDAWNPPDWLAAKPNLAAAKDFKRALHKKYGKSLRAWRCGIDNDDSGQATFKEMQHAAARVGFRGDVGGAFHALDQDAQGFVTLRELDPAAFSHLMAFRRWSHRYHGSVTLAYEALSKDRSGSLTFREFAQVMRGGHFKGDIAKVFSILNVEQGDSVKRSDVRFSLMTGASSCRHALRRSPRRPGLPARDPAAAAARIRAAPAAAGGAGPAGPPLAPPHMPAESLCTELSSFARTAGKQLGLQNALPGLSLLKHVGWKGLESPGLGLSRVHPASQAVASASVAPALRCSSTARQGNGKAPEEALRRPAAYGGGAPYRGRRPASARCCPRPLVEYRLVHRGEAWGRMCD